MIALRNRLNVLLRVLFILLIVLVCKGCEQKTDPLNLIVIYTDDQRFNTINALGNEEIYTPNMDRLVRMGTSFTRTHVMGSMHGAVCAPSRAMLLSGRPYHNIPMEYINQGSEGPLQFDFTTFPEQLRGLGYETFFTGKWHNNTGKLRDGFEDGDNIFIGGMHFPDKGGHKHPELWDYDPIGIYDKKDKFSGDEFSSKLYTDAALKFLNRNHTDPFCLYLAYTSPHDPREAPEDFLNIYDTSKISLPPNFLPNHPFNNGHLGTRDEQLAPFPRTSERVKLEIKGYYAMISEVDAQIGRVLDAIEAKGILENTLIIFAGDNGLAVGQHGLLGKQNLYDHSVRVPLIFAGVDIPKNKRASTLSYIHDIYPTICDLMGIEKPSSIQGLSLQPAIQTNDISLRDEVVLSHARQMRAIRNNDDIKLILTYNQGQRFNQLYNLKEDPYETKNLHRDPTFASLESSLSKELMEHILKSEDGFFEPDISVLYQDFKGPIYVRSDSPADGIELRYALDKESLSKNGEIYSKPIEILGGKELYIQSFYGGQGVSEIHSFSFNDFSNISDIEMGMAANIPYTGYGKFSLVDGVRGTTQFQEGNWLGYKGKDMSYTIFFDTPQSLSRLGIGYLQLPGSWIFPPASYEVLVSRGGEKFISIDNKDLAIPSLMKSETITLEEQYSLTGITAVQFKIRSISDIPSWHPGAGSPPWTFIDELIIQ